MICKTYEKKIDNQLSEKIKVISFIMTVGMIFYHSGDPGYLKPINETDLALYNLCNDLSGKIGVFVMNYFFMISGFFMYSNVSHFDKDIYLKKIKNRIFSLLIPFFIWQLLTNFLPLQTRFSLKEFLSGVFFFGGTLPNGPLWYCYSVFWLAVLSPVFYFLYKNKFGSLFLFISCFAIVLLKDVNSGIVGQIVNYGFLYNTFGYLSTYLIGLYIGIRFSENQSQRCFKEIFLIIILSYFFNYHNFLNIIINALLPIIFVHIFSIAKIRKDGKFYCLTNLTFLLYALHMYIIGRIQRPIRVHLILKIIPYAWTANIIARIIIIPIVIILTYILWILISKINPAVLNIIIGGRCKSSKDIQ